MAEQGLRANMRKAWIIGTLCSVSYLAVYLARNILGAVSPQITAEGTFTTEFIGTISSAYFSCYAVGQLINGIIGDRIKAKYMIGLGLIFAGICCFLFPLLAEHPAAIYLCYCATGFSLAMIYAPMTKVVAENVDPAYAPRCSLGYTLASFLGSPLAGVLASLLVWRSVFTVSSSLLLVMGLLCFLFFTIFEKKGYIQYGKFQPAKAAAVGSLKVLLKRQIGKFTLIAVLTGIVRTSVVFWLTTFISEYLDFPADTAAMLFTVATLVISSAALISVFVYERLGHNRDLTILLSFGISAVSFLLVFLCQAPYLCLAFITLAILACNSAATMLWSQYCPSLRDTGVVSSATGFLDFMSYMAASAASTLFANAVSDIGWGNLILIWCGLMVAGVIIALPYGKILKKAP